MLFYSDTQINKYWQIIPTDIQSSQSDNWGKSDALFCLLFHPAHHIFMMRADFSGFFTRCSCCWRTSWTPAAATSGGNVLELASVSFGGRGDPFATLPHTNNPLTPYGRASKNNNSPEQQLTPALLVLQRFSKRNSAVVSSSLTHTHQTKGCRDPVPAPTFIVVFEYFETEPSQTWETTLAQNRYTTNPAHLLLYQPPHF